MSPDQPLIFESAYNTFLNVPQFSEPLEAAVDGVTIVFRYPKEGELGFGAEPSSVICIARTVLHPDQRVRDAFAGFAERRLPSDSVILDEDRDKVGEDFYVTDNWAILRRWLPVWLQQYIDDLDETLSDASRRAVRLARWRLALGASHSPIRSAHLPKWSYDGVAWHTVPSGISARWEAVPYNIFPSFMLKDIGRLIEDAQVSEPLGHELLREAWNQREHNPRSALIVGIAAAEARVKEFITLLEPGASWLMENLTAPPLPSLLKNYVPELLVRHGIRPRLLPPPRDPIMQQLDQGIPLRNKVAHGVHQEIDFDTVHDVLLTIRDIHWMLDVFSGHEWARENVRPEVLARWDQ
jgi:hypothetical protein